MRFSSRFWGPVFGKEASLDAFGAALQFWLLGVLGVFKASRSLAIMINCKFAGVLPETFHLGFFA